MAPDTPVKMPTIRTAKQFLLTVSCNKSKNKTRLKSSDAATSATGTRHLHADCYREPNNKAHVLC